MRYDNRRIVFSPSDLIYWERDFPSWMDRWNLERENGNALPFSTVAAFPLELIALIGARR